jgi:hypothetical protein
MDEFEPVTRLGRRAIAGCTGRASGRWGAPGGPRPGSLPVTIRIVGGTDVDEALVEDGPRVDLPRSPDA